MFKYAFLITGLSCNTSLLYHILIDSNYTTWKTEKGKNHTLSIVHSIQTGLCKCYSFERTLVNNRIKK